MNMFDEKAVDWDDDPMKVKISHDFVAALTDAVKLDKGMRVLEFGCGTGIVAMELAGKVGSIAAVDTSAGMLGVLRKKIDASGVGNIEAMGADLLTEKPFKGGFDVIYSSMVLHHVADYEKVLAYFYEILNPGGVVAIADLDDEDGSFHSEKSAHVHPGFDRAGFKGSLTRTGFSELQDRTAFHIERQKEEGVRQYPVFLITARKPAN